MGIITLAEMKEHLRIVTTDDDNYITELILACTKAAEYFQNRSYLQQTRIMKFDAFPDVIRPNYPPLISVDSIQYVDTAGTTQTLDSANYTVDTTLEPGRIIPAYGLTWPSTRDHINAVTLTYQAGYGAASSVPAVVKWAVRLLVAHFYEHRESVTEIDLTEVPQAYRMLLMSEKVF
ncbi:MAG: phage head-tail connector protein [Firmicutes bacterium]|nr:phage head-tail connector protein [Bacillota bacterium]